ncbi:rubrerythrin family protein [Planktothrix paucivesiculata]|uniref:Rubrerythrin subfamily n=1 Tax=Planktothrix paucivesiculata PCC 9631 TaxID=671071 RepID=A0A7Z9BUX1_9CYAN|nr:rubrerythrin family protein [Planktothrix paucivesiculata]VXD22992.1 putative Rubrerythrin subfamily [Planktothrix paucivesiculata PCC 9631]
MNYSLKFRPLFRQTASLVTVTLLSGLSLVGCNSTPPAATTVPATPQAEASATPVAHTESVTLKNLQAAYNGESNAHARYLAFAKQATDEGYLQAASLFNAAADAEAIHAANHATVIRKFGGTPQAKIETPTIKSTAENLQEAIKGESYERDTMYPEFIKQARAEGNKEAVVTFTYAVDAEKQHAKFYTLAQNNLADWQEAKMTFYVCPECGFTTNALDFTNCPDCNTAENLFFSVS